MLDQSLYQRTSLDICYNRSETGLWNHGCKTAVVKQWCNVIETQTVRLE